MKLAVALGSAIVLGLAGAYAQEQKPPPDQNQPNRQQMPMGQGMMGGMMGGGMMEQMSRMMENCNKMMESHLQQRQQKAN